MKKAFVIFITMIFLFSAFAMIGNHGNDINQRSAVASEKNPTGNQNLYKLESIAHENGVPLKYISPPAAMPDVKYINGVIEPSYTNAPAPMGIGFYGTENINGILKGFNLTTPSVMASINISKMSEFYLLNDGPESETFQLNAVLNNVTLFGKSDYSFWTQNVAFYSARTHQIQFLVNIWNFSSPAITFTANSIYYHSSGFVCAPTFYYAIGPTINVTLPFTLKLYLNSTIINNDSAVFFNYSIKTSSMHVSGTYDEVLFNSTIAIKRPEYLASGTQLTPTGYIPYDFEIIVGGPGGGSTTSIYNINATMNLKYLDGNVYKNVPSAYDVGSETGETSEGIAVSWTGSTEHLTTGPSFVYGMWNISSSNRMAEFSGRISPSNAFAFVSPGMYFNESLAAWMPLSKNGSYNYYLPAGTYSGIAMLSYYTPAYFKPGSSLTLNRNSFYGIYTPLYAFNNNQVKNISYSGNGTYNNPYIITGNELFPISSLFEEFNDYGFPVFSGVLLMDVNVSIVFYNMPSMYILYDNPEYNNIIQFYDLPGYNYMNYEFYNDSNITLWSSPISGYFPETLSGFPVANVLIWNSTKMLIDSNIFNVMDSGLLTFDSPNVTIWGNYYFNDLYDYNNTFENATNIWGAPLGVAIFSSNETIYNNYFDVVLTAYSPDVSIYTGNHAVYKDRWNITKQPAYIAHYFNGFKLSGSIIGTGYQGGNYWYNFNGTIPYNDYGLIYYGGDYVPLYYNFYYYNF